MNYKKCTALLVGYLINMLFMIFRFGIVVGGSADFKDIPNREGDVKIWYGGYCKINFRLSLSFLLSKNLI